MNWLLKDGLFFLYSYQVLIGVKVVICFWADTISHYHALAKDISYYKWYVRPVFSRQPHSKNVITKGQLISKQNCWVVTSPKNQMKRTQDTILSVFRSFLGEVTARQLCFEIYWPLDL